MRRKILKMEKSYIKVSAKRYFSKSFTIADDVKVKGGELKDGLLKYLWKDNTRT